MQENLFNFARLEVEQLAAISQISKRNQKVIVSMSGGPDSTLLFLFLQHLAKAKKIILAGAIHFNFKLRGQESEDDQAFVEDLCNRFDVPLKCSIEKFKKEHNSTNNVQVWARDIRRQTYRELHKSGHIVALGHNQNDQAETLLMRIGRGTGPMGLGGMRSLYSGIWRPLLQTKRQDIIHWLETHRQPYRSDSSNASLKYRRNQVRHSVIPVYEQVYPGVLKHLHSLSEELSGVYELAVLQLKPLIRMALSERGIALSLFDTYQRSTLRYVLREILTTALVKHSPDHEKERSDGMDTWLSMLDGFFSERNRGAFVPLTFMLSPSTELICDAKRLRFRPVNGPLQHLRHRQSRDRLGLGPLSLVLGPKSRLHCSMVCNGRLLGLVLFNKTSRLLTVDLRVRAIKEIATCLSNSVLAKDVFPKSALTLSVKEKLCAFFDGEDWFSINAEGEKIAYCGDVDIRIE